MDRRMARAVSATLAVALCVPLAGCAAENPRMQSAAAASAWNAASDSAAAVGTTTQTPAAAAQGATATAAVTASATSAASTAKAAAPAAGKAGAAAVTAGVNDPKVVGDWTITVVAADLQPLDPKGNAAPSGKEILQIDTTAANNSKAPLKSPGGDYQLLDSSGAALKLAASDPGMGYNEGTGADAVAVGTEATFSMAYVVPAGAKGLTYVFTPSTGSKGTLKVKIR